MLHDQNLKIALKTSALEAKADFLLLQTSEEFGHACISQVVRGRKTFHQTIFINPVTFLIVIRV